MDLYVVLLVDFQLFNAVCSWDSALKSGNLGLLILWALHCSLCARGLQTPCLKAKGVSVRARFDDFILYQISDTSKD